MFIAPLLTAACRSVAAEKTDFSNNFLMDNEFMSEINWNETMRCKQKMLQKHLVTPRKEF